MQYNLRSYIIRVFVSICVLSYIKVFMPCYDFVLYHFVETPHFIRVSSSCPTNVDKLQADVLEFLSSRFGVSPLGLSREYAADSCEDITEANPNSIDGLYWIRTNSSTEQKNCIFI